MEELLLGIDIGGTTVKIGLVKHDGIFFTKWEIPTKKDNNGDALVKDIWSSVTETLSKQQIENDIIGIGVGVPGFVNHETGVVDEAVNIGWKNVNVREAFHKVSNLPVVVGNDANLAALAENWRGSEDISSHLIFVTLGTGVGGGIIVNGDIINGPNGTAGEIGHILVDPNGYRCNCGRIGCLETIASATGIVHLAMDNMKEDPNGALAERYEKLGKLEAKDVFELAKSGDQASVGIVDRITDVLGYSLANLAVAVNPTEILIGGGVSKAGEFLLAKIRSSFNKYALPRISDVCEVNLAQLGNDAGMIGAAYLVKQHLNK